MWGKNGENLKKVSLSDAIAVVSLRETSPRLRRIRLVCLFLLASTVPPVVCNAQPQGATWKQRKQKKKKKYADMKTTKDEIDYTNIFRFFAYFLSSNAMPCCRKPFSLSFFSHVVYRKNCLSQIQICRLDAGFYHYHGSETTPPCKQNYQYLVMNSPVQVRKGWV